MDNTKNEILEVISNMLLILKTDLPENEADKEFDKEFALQLESTISDPTDDNIMESLKLMDLYQKTHSNNALAQDLLALKDMEEADVLSANAADINLIPTEEEPPKEVEKPTQPETSQIQQVQEDLAKLQ
jgi:hypothetical protein